MIFTFINSFNAILSNRKYDEHAICSICQDTFKPEQEKWTHEGGLGNLHAPFHKDCLTAWVKIKPNCPYEPDLKINLDSLISKTERILRKTKKFITKAGVGMGFAASVFIGPGYSRLLRLPIDMLVRNSLIRSVFGAAMYGKISGISGSEMAASAIGMGDFAFNQQ